MNAAAVKLGKPLVMCAMYELETHLFTILPGRTPCLACLYPENPTPWKRQFPVFGAVSGMVGCLGATEAIKLIAGFGKPLAGELLVADLRNMTFRKLAIHRDPACRICAKA